MGIVLGANQYGKAETRLVRVDRDGDRHTVRRSQRQRGAARRPRGHASHRRQRDRAADRHAEEHGVRLRRAYGVGQIEDFGLRLARHFVDSQPSIDAARIAIEEYGWTRLGRTRSPATGGETRTAVLTYDGNEASAVGGLQGLVLLNSTDSEFWGYLKDAYTTLPETRDRILATEVAAHWRFGAMPVDWADSNAGVRAALIEAFVDTYSLSLQQTLYAMGYAGPGEAAGDRRGAAGLPNKHHFLVDLAPFGLDNPNEVFVADGPTVRADRGHGAARRCAPGRAGLVVSMDFLQPTTWADALAAKAERPDAVPIAGGTDLMVDLNFDGRRPPALLDLTAVAALGEWERDGEHLRIGAGVTVPADHRRAGAPLPGLAIASRTVGSPQIRNRATVGGNLGTASPAGDAHPPLLAGGRHGRGRVGARHPPRYRSTTSSSGPSATRWRRTS